MRSIYIASQYSNGGIIKTNQLLEKNVHIQMDYANEFMILGFLVHVPLLSHYQNKYIKQSYDVWMRQCFAELLRHDNVFRIKGKSFGANEEIKLAIKHGIPVYNNVDDLLIAQKDYCFSEIEEILNKKELKQFNEWMYDQTCYMNDIGEMLYYSHDIYRFLRMIRKNASTYLD
jgi:hypothetical protein